MKGTCLTDSSVLPHSHCAFGHSVLMAIIAVIAGQRKSRLGCLQGALGGSVGVEVKLSDRVSATRSSERRASGSEIRRVLPSSNLYSRPNPCAPRNSFPPLQT